MQFDSWQAVIEMGGYGFYVWLSFGVSFLAIGVLAVQGLRARTKLERAFKQEQHRQQRLARRHREVS
ncbi:heme exporter protein CcmD [Pseudidiomarina sediminum]|uniref:Heme exporter protein D n=1 Tax=Pseudidiomarina sediminum TaxID=431675 RepID=A0A432Z989_9GAMM|nr:heme exporter protein CcmD [Pseudidiomarina sediminum]MBY6063589.1 heme exporter protein CcmD [Pseudidiomarina sediminum]RUO74411.1 heme exporter protein CcmD [Pseudidiomarina sediminum]